MHMRDRTTQIREGQPFPGLAPAWRAITVGPESEDWAVVDDHGMVAYVGPAIIAARVAVYANE